MKFENTQVMNFKNALRGMRNPKNSWNKSDSVFGLVNTEWGMDDYLVAQDYIRNRHPNIEEGSEEWCDKEEEYSEWLVKNGILQLEDDIAEIAFIGPNDMKLAQTLIKAGPEHRKFLRQIFVSVDITAPVYWWKEMDTYKVATVANSTSSMHTLVNEPISIDLFETDDMDYSVISKEAENFIKSLEQLREMYIRTKDEKYWKELVRWLPAAWLQKRTWTGNYETLKAICSPGQRRSHKLNEWSGIHTPVEESFISWARTLPYAQEFIFIDEIQ